jgi:hypothetical protein
MHRPIKAPVAIHGLIAPSIRIPKTAAGLNSAPNSVLKRRLKPHWRLQAPHPNGWTTPIPACPLARRGLKLLWGGKEGP